MSWPVSSFAIDPDSSSGDGGFDGITIKRRSVFWLPLGVATWILGERGVRASHGDERRFQSSFGGTCGLTWQEFVAQASAATQQARAENGYHEDAHVLRLASLAVRLTSLPDSPTFPFKDFEPSIEFGPVEKGLPFLAVQWKLAPSAKLPPHNHPNYDICTLGLEGEARIQNFEVLGGEPGFSSREPFELRMTHDALVTPGRVNTLTSRRDNIHRFEAGPSGARGVDIGTLYTEDVGFSFLDIESEPIDATKRLYRATWAGR